MSLKSSLPFGGPLQGSPQLVICLRLILSSAFSSHTPTTLTSSTTSVDLLFGQGLFPESSNLSILYQHVSVCLLSMCQKHLTCSSDGSIPDLSILITPKEKINIFTSAIPPFLPSVFLRVHQPFFIKSIICDPEHFLKTM